MRGEKARAIMGRRNLGERKLGNAQARRVKLPAACLGRADGGWARKGSGRGRWEVVVLAGHGPGLGASAFLPSLLQVPLALHCPSGRLSNRLG